MNSIQQVVRVLPGHRIEIVALELREGELVNVVVLPHNGLTATATSALSFIDSLPNGPRAFATWEDYEKHLRKEKEAWER